MNIKTLHRRAMLLGIPAVVVAGLSAYQLKILTAQQPQQPPLPAAAAPVQYSIDFKTKLSRSMRRDVAAAVRQAELENVGHRMTIIGDITLVPGGIVIKRIDRVDIKRLPK